MKPVNSVEAAKVEMMLHMLSTPRGFDCWIDLEAGLMSQLDATSYLGLYDSRCG